MFAIGGRSRLPVSFSSHVRSRSLPVGTSIGDVLILSNGPRYNTRCNTPRNNATRTVGIAQLQQLANRVNDRVSSRWISNQEILIRGTGFAYLSDLRVTSVSAQSFTSRDSAQYQNPTEARIAASNEINARDAVARVSTDKRSDNLEEITM